VVRVLVTGGAGFIGKHLVRALLEKDYAVTVFDNFSNSTKDSISSLVNMGVKIIEGDITKPVEILDAVKDQELVIHLAAKISVQESIRNPSEIFQVNVEGTRNVLNSCKKQNVKKIIVASSAAVYGEGVSDVKLTEESKTNPISPYGESKLKMEQTIKEFCLKYSIDFVILRFFNIYGIGQTDEYAGVITKFMKRIREDKPITVFGDGLQTRDFVSIYDVINSIYNAISNDTGGTYNIASGKAVTIKELAEIIISASGKKLEIKYTSPKMGDIMFSQADISLGGNKIGYHPKFELREGIIQLL
jgi:UDP-glucose 4-epimerase